jgi:hypothetical protein
MVHYLLHVSNQKHSFRMRKNSYKDASLSILGRKPKGRIRKLSNSCYSNIRKSTKLVDQIICSWRK